MSLASCAQILRHEGPLSALEVAEGEGRQHIVVPAEVDLDSFRRQRWFPILYYIKACDFHGCDIFDQLTYFEYDDTCMLIRVRDLQII